MAGAALSGMPNKFPEDLKLYAEEQEIPNRLLSAVQTNKMQLAVCLTYFTAA